MNSMLFVETAFSLENPILQTLQQRQPKCAFLGKRPKMPQSHPVDKP